MGQGAVFKLLAVAASWGAFWGGWAALIPGIQHKLALTDQQLGLSLFAIPVAAVPAMLFTGRLTRRLAQHTLPLVTAVFAVGVGLTGIASSKLSFSMALLVVGGASGAIEVALNATTAAHESRDGVRLFNKVHAVTPLAMLIAAPAVGLARQVGASEVTVLGVIASLVALSAVLAVDPRGWAKFAVSEARSGGHQLRGLLFVVGGVGATALLMENAVEQWGAIHMEQGLGASPFLASFGPATYMAGLSVGRMLAQWKGSRYTDRTVVVLGGILGGSGLAIGAAAQSPQWALAGFALAGVGLAPVVPTVLGAAGRAGGARSSAISVVTTASYAGFLLSPPLVGTLAAGLGLSPALGLVALAGMLVATGAHAVHSLATRVPVARSEATT